MYAGMLFGSELFEPIVGEFLIAAATSKGRELSEKEMNLMQVRQRAACALFFADASKLAVGP